MATKPTLLKFFLEHNEDEEITCFFCKREKCEQSFTVRAGGEVRIIGVHNGCVDSHAESTMKRKGDQNGTS